jgi:hypothetical protein
VKAALGNDYTTYFMPTPTHAPSDPTHGVGLLEFIHYSVVLLDKQIVDYSVFRARKEPHIYNLLSRLEAFYNREGIDFY